MLGTMFISAAFAFLIAVHAASVEQARDDETSSGETTLPQPQSEGPVAMPMVMKRGEAQSGPGSPCTEGPCTTTEQVPEAMP
ncbi:hypothetical protein V5799_008421 [Amblyomma americanum]|uniref:Secreted protein n=1 Tax=Amblyomma americanum TaxID=6943 RepID=A0AAQ4FEH0_AMBAM